MTIGPAPMIRIDLMSVRLGMGVGLRLWRDFGMHWTQKKAALVRVLRRRRGPRKNQASRGRCVDQNRGRGKGRRPLGAQPWVHRTMDNRPRETVGRGDRWLRSGPAEARLKTHGYAGISAISPITTLPMARLARRSD